MLVDHVVATLAISITFYAFVYGMLAKNTLHPLGEVISGICFAVFSTLCLGPEVHPPPFISVDSLFFIYKY